MDKEWRINFRVMFDIESTKFDEYLDRGWLFGNDIRIEKKLRITEFLV